MRLHLFCVALAVALAGCVASGDRTSTPPADTSSAPMRVAPSFTMREAYDGYAVEIPYVYTNRTGAPIYLINCNGDVSPGLERLVDGRWQQWWIPATNACLSPPVVIDADARYADTLHMVITPTDGPAFAQLVESGGRGTYRLVWHQAVSSYTMDGPPLGEPLAHEHRVSNPFRLVLP